MLAEAHHFIVTRNQQRVRPEPCERAGDADGGIADERGQPDGGGKPHDKLDHAGEEGRATVLHALDGGTVDGEQSEQKVKRCDNCKVDIGIMINFRCRVGEEHPYDRMRSRRIPAHIRRLKASVWIRQARTPMRMRSVLPAPKFWAT